MQPLLTIKNLCIQFSNGTGSSIAVANSSFEMAAGETLAIVGESGSGKSVTALSLLKLLPEGCCVTGEVLFYQDHNAPIDLLKLPDRKINDIRGNKIAMIFQEPMTSLNPLLTCGKQVMEALQLHQKVSKKVAREKTIELFKNVQLSDPATLIRRYPHQLSGGQKQRVMIAMAMSCNPTLLIADEPTTALDVTVQKTILELINKLRQQNNMAVILITHDLGVVADVADKILVMRNGEIIEHGIAENILLNPKHPYTKALLACRPVMQQRGKRLPVVDDFINASLNQANDNLLYPTDEIVFPTTDDKQPITILKVENLKVYFPVKKNLLGKPTQFFKAVDDVSFQIKKREILGLVGESGCGKTTLGKTILQLIKPTAGKILLEGKDITHMGASSLQSMRKDLQIVFQDPYGSLNPRITIGDAILEPLQVHKILDHRRQRKEKVMELLEKVNLSTDYFNRYPHQFSGGQRQRICIARALALNPSFLVFDESVSALDVSVQAQVLNLLNDLRKDFDFTSIFISHDLSVVHYLCNRILVMHKGKIVEEGDADQIYHHPNNEYTQKLIDAIPGKKLLGANQYASKTFYYNN